MDRFGFDLALNSNISILMEVTFILKLSSELKTGED